MNIAFAEKLPEALVKRLYAADRESGSAPILLPGEREQALNWLRRALVEFDSLDQHIGLLQKLYGSPFQYPRPRRDAWNLGQPVEPPPESTFTHATELDDEKVTAILDRGVDCLSDNEIAQLLLNPFALFDLFDCIDDVQPDYWIGAIHDFVSVRGEPQQSISHLAQGNGRGYSPVAPLQPVSPPESDFWANLTVAIATAVKDARGPTAAVSVASKQEDDTAIPPPSQAAERASSTRFNALQYALALAASVAVVFVGWSVLQMANAVNGLPQQIAALQPKNAGESPRTRNGIALTAGSGDMFTLDELDQRGFLEPQHYRQENPKEYLDDIKASAEPALRALIETKQQQLSDDLKVLDFLHSLVATPSTDK